MNRQIFVFSGIDSYTAEYIIRQLLAYDRESSDEITMFINSPGGSVTQMFAILDTMSMIKSPVRTVVVGMAASAAAVIASAGRTRLISSTSQVMIHQASAGTFGSVQEMQESMEQIVKLNEQMLQSLSRYTRQPLMTLKDLTNKTDKYFSAQEAVTFGLIDKVIQDNEAQVLKLSEGINVEGYEFSEENKEVQILKEGNFIHPVLGELPITESILNQLKKNFEARVRNIDISIDFTHDNDSGEKPAAFWIKSLEVRSNEDGQGKGLYAKGEFTPAGLKKISEKEYKYSSADFVIDYVDENGKHHPYVLRGGTLTNRPFIKGMNPIKLSEFNPTSKEKIEMDKTALIAALKAQGLDVSALEAKLTSAEAKVAELEAKIRELAALPVQKDTEIAELKGKLTEVTNQIVESEKVRVFNSLVALGKVVPAQKEDIFKTFAKAEEIEAFYKSAPVVVKKSPDGVNTENDDILSEAELALVATGKYTKEEIVKYRTTKKVAA